MTPTAPREYLKKAVDPEVEALKEKSPRKTPFGKGFDKRWNSEMDNPSVITRTLAKSRECSSMFVKRKEVWSADHSERVVAENFKCGRKENDEIGTQEAGAEGLTLDHSDNVSVAVQDKAGASKWDFVRSPSLDAHELGIREGIKNAIDVQAIKTMARRR
jgi:hypothetical protein